MPEVHEWVDSVWVCAFGNCTKKREKEMAKIENIQVYGIKDSFRASKFPFAVDIDAVNGEYTDRIKSLAQCKAGTGHDNFLNGIIVQFDLTFSIKAWVEAERYHFFDFISSQSTMHCISKMDIRPMCNKYVSDVVIAEVERLKQAYLEDKTDENYLALLYNVPVGFELTARMTTNYRQLKTMYEQRKTHRLPDWNTFCKFVENLPYSELIIQKVH